MKRALLALALAGCTAQQAEVRTVPTAPADELEVSPGLNPEDVQRALDAARPQLRSCMRLDLPDEDDARLDDRVLLEFEVVPAQTDNPVHVTRSRSIFLDDRCLSDWADLVEMPQLKYVTRAEVQWRSHFRTTVAERQAERAHIARDLKAFCDQFQTHYAHALSVGWAGEPNPVPDAAQSVLAGADVSSRAKALLHAITMVNPSDHAALYSSLAKEVGAQPCPNLEGYYERVPQK